MPATLTKPKNKLQPSVTFIHSKAIDTPAITIPSDANTWNGFRRWAKSDHFPEHGKISFLGGEVNIDMSSERVNSHVNLKTQILHSLVIHSDEIDDGTPFADGALISNKVAKLSHEPDATYILHASFDSGKVKAVPTSRGDDIHEFVGSPDLVVEIVSPSSVHKDTTLLRERYHLAEIDEYWLIDARGESIDFQLLHWRKSGYQASPSRDDWRRSNVLQREVRILRRRGLRNIVQYKIEMRPFASSRS